MRAFGGSKAPTITSKPLIDTANRLTQNNELIISNTKALRHIIEFIGRIQVPSIYKNHREVG